MPKVKKSKQIRPIRSSLLPGTVCILLAGTYRGRRVIFLKQLESGLLLITGPFSLNGVPLRRADQSYVIATKTRIDISGLSLENINDSFFESVKKKKFKSIKESDKFFEKAEEKVKITPDRKKIQFDIDAPIIAKIKSEPSLKQYISSKFSLTRGQLPHEMIF